MTVAAAVRWFDQREAGDGVTLFWEPHVHPFFRCNIWHVRGRDCDLVIDFGMGLRPLRPELALTPGKPLIALATHAHVDHIGGFHEFADRRAHAEAGAAYRDMPDDVTLAPLFRDLEAPVDALPAPGWTAAGYRLAPAPLHLGLKGGERLDLGDRTVHVLSLPGHSPDSLGFFDETGGLLFSGDALYDGGLVDDFPTSNVSRYLQTMILLRDLPIRIGHGGHGPSFDEARKNQLVDDYLRAKRQPGCPHEQLQI